MKNVKYLKENEVIWCKTKDECEAIAELLHKENFVWKNGVTYTKDKLWENQYIRNFCFRPRTGNWGVLELFQYKGHTIHEAKDFIASPEKLYTESEVKLIQMLLLEDIIKDWHKSKFQKQLITIIRERL